MFILCALYDERTLKEAGIIAQTHDAHTPKTRYVSLPQAKKLRGTEKNEPATYTLLSNTGHMVPKSRVTCRLLLESWSRQYMAISDGTMACAARVLWVMKEVWLCVQMVWMSV